MNRLTERGFKFTSNYVAQRLQAFPIAQCLSKLQEYEDAEEEGLLVRLPCKVGGYSALIHNEGAYMKYHRGKRFGLSEEKQSLIYWICVNYNNLPFEIRHNIINLCNEVGGTYNSVLFKAITTTESVTDIAYQTYYTSMPINDSNLARMVRRFYEVW